jgi:hypothetical protein
LHKGEDSVLLDILKMLLIVYCCLLRVYSVPAPVLIVKMSKLPFKTPGPDKKWPKDIPGCEDEARLALNFRHKGKITLWGQAVRPTSQPESQQPKRVWQGVREVRARVQSLGSRSWL